MIVPREAVVSGAISALLRARISLTALPACGVRCRPSISAEWPAEVVDEGYYALGNYSYFGESAYEMDDWPARLWGDEVFERLSAIKARVDPDGVFWCRHCIGDLVPKKSK